MDLPKSTLQRIMKSVLDEQNKRIGNSAVLKLSYYTEQFITNLTIEALQLMSDEGMVTLKDRHIIKALNSRNLILKIYPMVSEKT